MRKKFLILSIVFLLFLTLSYTYSAFNSVIVGNISGNIKDWVFKVNIDNSTTYNDSYKLHLSGTSGSFNVNINTVGGAKGADYSIELIGDSSIKYYTDSNYTNLISNNIYNGSINSNTSGTITIYYKSDSNINSDILIKTKGNIMEVAMMKNGHSYSNGGTEFWNNTYKPYIRTVDFGNDLSNLPSSCTEENLCWDISNDASQKKKVYGYLKDSGYKDSTDTTKKLYNLYIVSETQIFAPSDCSSIFSFSKSESNKYISNLIQINFNNNFDTSNVTSMTSMFGYCPSLNNLNLSGFDTSNVTNMDWMFSLCSSLTSLDLSSFDTSNVTSVRQMFSRCSSLTNLNLSNLNPSNIANMSSMFSRCSSLTTLDLSNFNASNATDMSYMFNYCTSLSSLNLSSFNTSNVTNMKSMFAYCQSLKTIDLSSFNTLNVTNMYYMFNYCTSLNSLNLSSFNTSNVTIMYGMFQKCSSLKNLDLSSFDTSNVTDMCNMFCDCSSLTSLNLSNFNTSNVEDMGIMFSGCSSLTSLDLSTFNTSNVTSMRAMFQSCTLLANLNLSNFNTTKVTNMSYMFSGAPKIITTIGIMNTNTKYEKMFNNAATASGARITVNYITAANSLVTSMIATKSSSSKVVKGSIITEYSITISGNNDITYESNNRVKGSTIMLTSTSGNNYVTSFKMNGTTVNGNEFTMPESNVTITDIVTISCKTIETAHYPYLNSQNNVVLGEYTFENAKSLTVILDYETFYTYYDYFYIYDSSTATSGINDNKEYGGTTRTKETITINSNYIKIVFTSSGSDNNYFGLRAIVIPNY